VHGGDLVHRLCSHRRPGRRESRGHRATRSQPTLVNRLRASYTDPLDNPA
jgi:hypothetical protein